MTVHELLSHLNRLNVKLWIEGDRLRCSAPKGVLTPEWQAQLAEHKDEIMALLERTHLAAPPLLPASRDTILPLSFAQQRMWFMEQFDPGQPTYTIPIALRLTGSLDWAALRFGLNEIVRRHEVLRTTFAARDGQPIQVIGSSLVLDVPLHDLSLLDQPETEARRLMAALARRPFDLERGPLIRANLLKLGEQDHILLLTLHHIVFDGWSLAILMRELGELYQAFRSGKPSPLPKMPLQYADFAVWQRAWLQGTVLEKQLDYWTRRLAGSPPVLELPADRPRPAMQSYLGDVFSLALPPTLSDDLKAICQQENVTLFMLLLAAFQVLLYRYSGQADLVIGTSIANRNRAEIENLIGFFVNTLALRTRLDGVSGNPTFRDLLARVRQTALEAYAHQDMPFEKLVEELHPERQLSHAPLFQVMFAFQNAPLERLELPGLALQLMEVENRVAKFDLSLSIEETEYGLAGVFEYNTDLFDPDRIARMAGHWQTLLAGITALGGLDQPILELPLLTEGERRQLLVDWNTPPKAGGVMTAPDHNLCAHQLFEMQARRTPDAVAVVSFADSPGACAQHVTYQELDARANQLAQYLQKLGVEPEVRVGVCTERSPETLIGLLGIFKAGGVCVPFDPASPPERLTFMQADAQLKVMLSQRRLAAGLPNLPAPTIALDADWELIAQEPTASPLGGVLADHLAYVIYTSGSTGQPRGVLVPHRALTHQSVAVAGRYQLQATDRQMQFASLQFDVAFEEILAPLSTGAALVLRPAWLNATDDLSSFQAQERLTVLNLPAPFWHEWVAELDASHRPLPGLRLVIVGSDIVLPDRWLAWHTRPNPIACYNAYGLTEATITTTVYEPPPAWQARLEKTVPIGRPLANVQVYVLDPYLQPVPAGVPGELYIGGECLARCYENRPDLTAEKFIPNPFTPSYPLPQAGGEKTPSYPPPQAGGGKGGDRLYRTGDRVCWRPDGNLEFLGRLDRQVKLRGYRIEPGEIEARLSQHPAVRECAVLTCDDPNGSRLVAYVVASTAPPPTPGDLRAFLKTHLPEYMLPSAFIFLDAMPLTPSGKLDRRRLPAPQPERSSSGNGQPRTPTEAGLAEIWASVLHLERAGGQPVVGVHDHFFELGGHSLLATQVISRIRTVFQVELPLRALFEAPTIADLALQLEQARANHPAGPPMVPADRAGPMPLSFAQARLWFMDQFEPNQPTYNMPISLRMVGPLDIAALYKSLNEIMRRHEALRTTIAAVDGQPVQVIAPAMDIALPIVDLGLLAQDAQSIQVRQLATEEAYRPFDLSRGPLLRASLLRSGPQDYVLLLTLHHIISDGWSVGILMRELAALYPAFSDGRPSPLPKLPLQYADFAVWQRAWLQGQELDRQKAYWIQQLAGSPPVLELPADRPRPAMPSYRGDAIPVTLSPGLSRALKTLCQQEGVTLFMALLAAFQVLLHRYSGQTDVVVGAPIANRNRAETENLIGFFVNTLVLRTSLAGRPTFRELLARVRQTALDAYAHQDLPFEKLVEELHPGRTLSHSPLFQVTFAFQNMLASQIELPGLALLPVEVDTRTANFDLSLSMEETKDGLAGWLNYATDLFEADRMVRLVRHWQTLLEDIAANPGQRISDLALMPPDEQAQILRAGHVAQSTNSPSQPVHQMFEAQVQRAPDAVALVWQDQHVTYARLNARANQIAHWMKEKGVGPDSVAAVLDDPTPELIAILLGALKAGGAYFPIDPRQPAERIVSMLDGSQASLVLARATTEIAFTWLQNLQDVGDAVVVTPARPQIRDLDALPFPDRRLADYTRYDQHIGDGCMKGSISLLATRGCPYRCLYCHTLWPKRHVARSAQNIFEEVQFHYDRGYRVFKFLDDTFNLERKNSRAFFELVIKNNLKLHLLFPSGLRGDLLAHDDIDLMAEAGTTLIALALETASPRLQRLIGKNLDVEKLRDNLVYLCDQYPHIISELFTMVGFPTETEQEALMTLDFVKQIRWLHFPYLNILRIFPHTGMARLAMEHGMPEAAIARSSRLSFHDPGETLPFAPSFAREYQTRFMEEYLTLPERLEHVIPLQRRVLTRVELVSKYASYLPGGLENYPHLMNLVDAGAFPEQNEPGESQPVRLFSTPAAEEAGPQESKTGQLRILLIDLSQHFCRDMEGQLYNLVEAPLGLMYLLTYLNHTLGERVCGKILKSMIDFDSFDQLRALVEDYAPHVIGVRSLSIYKDMFHQALALLKTWCPEVPIIAGGPYATSEYTTLLADRNVDLIVLGEGELTLAEVIGRMLENEGRWPEESSLRQIPGLAFVPRSHMDARRARPVVWLDTLADEIGRYAGDSPAGVPYPESLAYVIATSGSTGEPKGVMVSHQAIARHCSSLRACYQIKPDDNVLQFASPSLDTSLEQILATLAAGAKLVLRGSEMWRVEDLDRHVLEQRLTVIDLPPAYWHPVVQFWAETTRAAPTSLRLMIVGGDLMPPDGLKVWRRLAPNTIRLLNAYGPTEATVTAAVFEIGGNFAATGAGIPIGWPLPHAAFYILDPYGQPTPMGVPGELYIGGEGLARGYRERPDLTAERFVPNPFAPSHPSPQAGGERGGGRLYRTGDLACWRPDGAVEFLGRVDHQVKLRGYRIELGEIEAVLARHPAVRQTVVLLREDQPDRKQLVAYIVCQSTDAAGRVPPDVLRAHLKQTLPDYMLPAAFVFMEALPLTPNGKVDRRALPGPDRQEIQASYVAPCSPAEEALAAIWAEVLGLEQVNHHSSFFELGGHSLLAIRLASRIKQSLGQDLELPVLFQGATIQSLAETLSRPAHPSKWSPLVAIHPAGSKPPFFCVHGGPGLVLRYFTLAHHLGPDQPFYGLQAAGIDEGQAPLLQVESLAASYLQAVRAVQPVGPYYLGGWCIGGTIAFEMARQLHQQGQPVAMLALLNTWAPVPAFTHQALDDDMLMAGFVKDWFEYKLQLPPDELAALEPDRRLACILEQAQEAQLLPPGTQPAQLGRFWQVYNANARAINEYTPSRYGGPITLFRAMEEPPDLTCGPAWGWDELTTAGVQVQWIPSNHFSMFQDPAVRRLAEFLNVALRAADSGSYGKASST